MKRDLSSKLVAWKNSSRRKPLILEGARQVGKTWLLQEFGKTHYKNMAYFNFEEDPHLDDLFRDKLDPAVIIERLSLYQNQKIIPEDSLIFFDEIQNSENALNSLKYFQEKAGEYHVVSAGSLLGLKLRKIKSFPVGKVNFLHLYPLIFFEFLEAMSKPGLRTLLEKQKDFTPLPSPFHEELIDLLKIYYFTGGMPEVVSSYAEERDVTRVREIQSEILKSFAFDFSKYAAPTDMMKINQIWSSVPVHLARENKKFTFTTLRKNARAREYETALQWLIDAGLIYLSYKISLPGIPLEGYREENFFKIYLLDTGLLGAMSALSSRTLVEGNELFTHFKGALVENYVAQELRSKYETNLYYWASQGQAEVDFIVSHDEKILPLEVKAGKNQRSHSLQEYAKKHNPPVLSCTSLSHFEVHGQRVNYPLYAISLFPYSMES